VRRAAFTLAIATGTIPPPLLGTQAPDAAAFATTARTGVMIESYSLGRRLAFHRITELVIPLSVSRRLGSRVTVDLSTAYASASVRTVGGDIDVSGFVDTDLRAVVAVVPGRLMLTLVGTLPTGVETVPDTALPLFGATATDLFGFMVPSLGTGGGITGGFATAFRLGGSWAVGTGASYKRAASYVPVQGGGELSPGAEGRLRLGVEGPLAGGKYFRAALLYSLSEHDRISDGRVSIIGDRALLYGSLNLPLGRGALSLYGWNMHRFRPRASTSTYDTATQVPRGNLLAFGARLERPVSRAFAVAPGFEVRHELTGRESLAVLGYLVRPGVDVRYRVSAQVAVVGSAQYAFGQLRDEGVTVWVHGPRLGLLLEWVR
jgi:hypothetical protein